VVASFLSAVVQGPLAGAGYFVAFSTGGESAVAAQESTDADVSDAAKSGAAAVATPKSAAIEEDESGDSDAHGAPIMLLTMLTMVMAIVPFVGAASVWSLVSLGIWLIDGRPVAAGALAVYGALIVSNVDNLIKPLVLHGQSNLHPLLALISVLGGVQVLGPVGIIVGPMLVAFVQALLVMVNRELKDWDADGDETGLLESADSAIRDVADAIADGHAPPGKEDRQSSRPRGQVGTPDKAPLIEELPTRPSGKKKRRSSRGKQRRRKPGSDS
jgi:hypothetical protein